MLFKPVKITLLHCVIGQSLITFVDLTITGHLFGL